MIRLLLLSLLIGFPAFAIELPEFQGNYSFSAEKLIVTQTQNIVSVQLRSDDARKYVDSLVSQGYQCQLGAHSISSCKIFLKPVNEDQNVRAEIVAALSPQQLFFGEAKGSYQQVNDSPMLKEYERLQNVGFGLDKFDRVRLMYLNGILKIKLYTNGSDVSTYFYLNENSEISQQVTAVKTNSKQNANVIQDRNLYVYEATWTK